MCSEYRVVRGETVPSTAPLTSDLESLSDIFQIAHPLDRFGAVGVSIQLTGGNDEYRESPA